MTIEQTPGEPVACRCGKCPALGLVDVDLSDNAHPRPRVGVTEEIAKIVYDAMREVQPPSVSTKPWVENGNAISQDIARYAARRILTLADSPAPLANGGGEVARG